MVFVLEFRVRNLDSHNNEPMRITNKHRTDSDPGCANENNEKTIVDEKQAQGLFTTHAFIYKIGDIAIDRMHSVQCPSRNVQTSRPPAVTAVV